MRYGTQVMWWAVLATAAPARAEIAIADSVEWLCARADVVAVGRLTEVVGPSEGLGKNEDLVSLTLQPEVTAKGGPGPVHFSVRMPDSTALRQHRDRGTVMVAFLHRTPAAYMRDGVVHDLWPLRAEGSDAQLLLPLDGSGLLLADGFRRARTAADVARACAEAPAAKVPYFLEIPFDSEAHAAVYGGSSCFLRVPPAMFPAAKPDLR
jgi:hypothetical protein